MLPGFPKTGTPVRFQPPENAYSQECEQSRQAGKSGLIYRVDNDSFAMVLFGKSLVMVNTAYLSVA